MNARKPNVGTGERVARVIGGGLVAGLGLALLIMGSGAVWLIAADVVLITLGADFVVTGLTGHCPLYRWLGWSTARPHTPLRMGH